MFDWKYASGLSYLQRIPPSSQNNRVLTFEYTRVNSTHIDLNFTFTSYENDTVFSMLTLDNTTFSQPGHTLRHTGKRAIIFEKGQYRKMYKNMQKLGRFSTIYEKGTLMRATIPRVTSL